jgi:O-acetyl-ADP-ribose deacetylase (regulator of RNase III)
MNIILADINEEIVQSWRKRFAEMDDVSIHQGSIFDVECDAIVSPANSFGFMDGGIDLRISEYFGWHVQESLQEIIRTKHCGGLLVGDAEIVESKHPKIPYVIAAPTMRVPMNIADTINAYLAVRAVILLVQHGHLADGRVVKEVVKTVAFPGMGTGTGHVAPHICAFQMKEAIKDVLYGNFEYPASWRHAKYRHERMIFGMPVRK